MKIVPNQLFKHDYGHFEPGVEYDVPDALGGYFVGVGWADAVDYDTESPEAAEVVSTTPPRGFFVSKDMQVHKTTDDHRAVRSPEDGTLVIHDSTTGQETEL